MAYKNAEEGLKLCKILNKPSQNCQRLLKCHQSGEFSPNLATLITVSTRQEKGDDESAKFCLFLVPSQKVVFDANF